jgi:hypothetical protein
MIMKKILSLIMGMGLVVSLGLAYAEESMGSAGDTGDKIIRDDDLLHFDLDQNRATINQLPAAPGTEGSAAGGIRGEPENKGIDIEQSKEPSDKGPATPGEEGTGAGGTSKVPERYGY